MKGVVNPARHGAERIRDHVVGALENRELRAVAQESVGHAFIVMRSAGLMLNPADQTELAPRLRRDREFAGRSTKYRVVRPIRKHKPLIRLTRESYHVFPMAARTTIRPITEPHPFKGDGAGIAEACAGVILRRKEMWAARETIQESNMPKKAPRKM